MSLFDRESEIFNLLTTALDSDEEYLFEAEFRSYMRSIASDATGDLRWIFQRSKQANGTPLTESEIALCVREIIKPERLANGVSKAVIQSFGSDGCFILDAIARLPDVRLRLFALEVAGKNQFDSQYYLPICTLLGDALHLIEDSDETVRLAAVESAKWMHCNKTFIERNIGVNESHIVLRIYRAMLARLADDSPKIRQAAAVQLGEWAAYVARASLVARLESETDPQTRETLARLIEKNQTGG
jgi:hypothetical protein